MAKQHMLSRQITRILKAMEDKHVKPPISNDCCGAKATRRPWRGKSPKLSHIKKETNPGDIVSVDQLRSSIPGFIGQITGRLTRQRIVGSTIYVDHASDLSYVYHQTSMSLWNLSSLQPHMESISNTTMKIMASSNIISS
jgi:hypothetical protein